MQFFVISFSPDLLYEFAHLVGHHQFLFLWLYVKLDLLVFVLDCLQFLMERFLLFVVTSKHLDGSQARVSHLTIQDQKSEFFNRLAEPLLPLLDDGSVLYILDVFCPRSFGIQGIVPLSLCLLLLE